MLPVKDLVYPGSVEESREFTKADDSRLIDGGTLDQPATLRVTYRVDGPFDMKPIVAWYRDRLSEAGWKPFDYVEQEGSLDSYITEDGYDHTFAIESYGSVAQYEVVYTIRPAE